MKTDARVRYTRHMIQTVFLELLKEKPLSKITVKELCEKAEINRGTFYKHYQDVYDLMEQMEEEALNTFENLLTESVSIGSTTLLVTLLKSLQNNSQLIQSLLAQSASSDFINRLTERCTHFAFSHLDTADSADSALWSSSPKQYAYSYLAGGTENVIKRWLKTGAKEDPQILADYIEQMNQLSLRAFH